MASVEPDSRSAEFYRALSIIAQLATKLCPKNNLTVCGMANC